MSVVMQIAAIQALLHALKDRVPPNLWADTALPVVAAPGAWLALVGKELGQLEGMVPQYIHGCPVVQEDSLDEPVMVTHDSKVYAVNRFVPDGNLPEDEPGPALLAKLRAGLAIDTPGPSV